MGIRASQSYIHWNYFIALDQDLEQTSRYIEFDKWNYKTYSIELAHLLLASASEVDVIAKEICHYLDSTKQAENICQYRKIIRQNLPIFEKESVYVPRFNLKLHPWTNWKRDKTPLWWRSYNNVKHNRNEHFSEANLKNVLNAMGGLLVAVFYFYKLKFMSEGLSIEKNRDVTKELGADSGFMKLRDNYYYGHLLLE